MALELLNTWVGRQFPFVEVAVRGDDEVEIDIVGTRLRNVQDVQGPLSFFGVPLC